MDADSLTNKFWEGIQTLSLADTIDYIDDPNLLLQPEGKVVCIRNNTGPHDLKALEALLRLHRYSFLHSPTDVVQSYRIALSSLSLADEPGHACLFFLLSSHSWDLFERTKQLQHLTNAIDLLSDLLHFLGVEQLGPHVYSVVSVVFACICMQFCLKEGEKEARETAIEALKDARREASRLKWVSSTRTRTVVVIADIMRYRYEEFGPQGEFNAASVDILMSILDTIPTSGDSKFQFTALRILTTSLIFQLSKERDASTWHNDLCALHSLTSLAFSTVTSPIIEPPPKETLEKLATSLRQCKIASYTRPLCLIFTADHLDSHEEPPEVDVTAQSSRIGFAEECERAREHFLKLLNFLKCKSQFTASATEEETKRQWELEGIFNSLLGRARQVPGFEKLLMPKGYEELLQASAGGPVVVLLGNDSTYAALVVRPTGVDAVWLTDLTDASMEKFIAGLNRASKDARSIVTENREEEEDGDDERKMGPMKSALMPSYEAYLSGLWKFIAKPVLEFLGLLKSKAIEKRPRLWWCPTGRFTFLPIHAAGVNFGKDTFEGVMKYTVSSYTPTLSALIASRKKMERSSTAVVSDLTTLVLAQPKTPGHASLPMTLKELETLEEIIPPDLLLRVGEGTLSEANSNRKVDEAMKYIEEAAILHLACHGHQDRADPLNSGFELSDGRLSLSKLISCRNPNAFLAFLSACESAANDVDVPDESLNLAAAMLFAGFRSVIGTMWTMNDSDGPQVAKIVYEELFKKTDVEVSPDAIAYALDIAVRKLQESGIHASRWATYIHVGM